ncbi:MAG: YfiR family protein [Bacteroidota bacterium]
MKKLKIASIIVLLSMSFTHKNRPEHELHAMMLYNFIKYIEWPVSQHEFTIGVIGNSDVFNTLNQWYGGKIRGGKKFKIVELKSARDSQPYHIIYFGSTSKDEFRTVKERVKNKPTLLITNKSGFAQLGSAINFKKVGNSLRFELNQQAISEANLKVSSQLTAMAIVL